MRVDGVMVELVGRTTLRARFWALFGHDEIEIT
jgi:hypothetical protein